MIRRWLNGHDVTPDLMSPAGSLFRRTADLDFALRKGFAIPYAEIDAERFAALKVLDEEFTRHQEREAAQAKRPAMKMTTIG